MAAHIDVHDAHAHHPPGLQHQFDDMEQQKEAVTIGMWMFLVQELMFFGGIFMVYLLYRSKYPLAFAMGSNHLDLSWGLFNTVVLILSSLTMAMAVWSAQKSNRNLQVIFILVTMILGGVFLGVKAIEYTDKYHHNLIPFAPFEFKWHPEGEEAQLERTLADTEPAFAAEAKMIKADYHLFEGKVQIFYWIYFAMTGLHALHMVIGIGIMIWLLITAWQGRYSADYYGPVEISGLYWHFVDIVWIFLFPMLYLLGRHFGAGH